MTKFYKDANGYWILGDKILPAGSCVIDYDDINNIVITSISDKTDIKFAGPLSQLGDSSDTAYSTVALLLSAVAGFFAKALDVEGLYSATSSVLVTNTTNDTSLLSSPITIKANSLRAGDIIKVLLDGRFGTASTASTGAISIKLGSTILLTNSRTLTAGLVLDLTMVRSSIDLAIRSIGTSGKAIVFGNILSKDSTTASAGDLRALLGTEVSIDTTIDNVLDITYKFGTASASNSIAIDICDIVIYRK